MDTYDSSGRRRSGVFVRNHRYAEGAKEIERRARIEAFSADRARDAHKPSAYMPPPTWALALAMACVVEIGQTLASGEEFTVLLCDDSKVLIARANSMARLTVCVRGLPVRGFKAALVAGGVVRVECTWALSSSMVAVLPRAATSGSASHRQQATESVPLFV